MDDDTKDKSSYEPQSQTEAERDDSAMQDEMAPLQHEQDESEEDAKSLLPASKMQVALSKSDKAVSTYGMPDLEDYQRAVTYEIVFNSLLEKKMQAMKRDCEERKRNKRLKRKSIGRIFLSKRLFSSVDSRKSSMLSESAEGPCEPLQAHSEPTTPQKLTKISSSKTAIKKDHGPKPTVPVVQDTEMDRSSLSIQSPLSRHSSQLRSPHTRSKSKSNTASSESQQLPPSSTLTQAGAGADDSITSTLSNSSGKMVKHNVLVLAQTHGTPSEIHISSSSGDSKAGSGLRSADIVPSHSRELTCDTASLASGYGNGAGARLNSNTICDDSLTSLRDSIESLSFASSRCTVSFGATEIIPEAVAYERVKAAVKRQRILDAKSISAQCSPILPSRHVIKTMVHAPMSPPVTKVAAAQPPINIIEPLPSTATAMPPPQGLELAAPQSRRPFLPNQFSYTDSLFESRNISRQNTSEDSANLTVSTLLNQSDSSSLAPHVSPTPTTGFRAADFALSGVGGKPVSVNDRFKSKSTGILVALGNGRTRPPPPPPPCESAQPSPVAIPSPPELTSRHALPIAELQQLQIASNIKKKLLVDSYKLATQSAIAATTTSPPSPPSPPTKTNKAPASASFSVAPVTTAQSLHIVTMASTSELPQQYPVIESSSSATLVAGAAPTYTAAYPLGLIHADGNGHTAAAAAMTNGAIVTSSSMVADDTAKLHRMTSTSTGSSIGPTGCCTTTKSSTRLKEKQRFTPPHHIIPSGQSGSDDEYRRKKRKYKRYHRCSDPVLVYPTSSGLQHCILTMPPNDPIQYPYTEDYAYDMQLQMESDKNDDLEKIVPSDSTKRKHHKHRHHRHKKRNRHKKPKILVQDLETQEVKVIDPDDLPQRARWTIIATACLLLLMCLMLVGITLRMAPIIDDMGEYTPLSLSQLIEMHSKFCLLSRM